MSSWVHANQVQEHGEGRSETACKIQIKEDSTPEIISSHFGFHFTPLPPQSSSASQTNKKIATLARLRIQLDASIEWSKSGTESISISNHIHRACVADLRITSTKHDAHHPRSSSQMACIPCSLAHLFYTSEA